ncbi:UNVERIFIED_CONTAM: hypothetical protein FKN15_000417 [Acipenser sinensis]
MSVISSVPSGSSRSRRYRTRAYTSQVDETLFATPKKLSGSENQGSKAQGGSAPRGLSHSAPNRRTQKPETVRIITKDLIRDLRIPSEDPSGLSVIMSPQEFQRITSASRVLTAEEKEAELAAKTRKREAAILILGSQCHAIRDTQILEKKQILSELQEEEKRLDAMMEVERRRAIKMQEEIDEMRKQQRIEGKVQIIQQMAERQEERLLNEEFKEQEGQHVLDKLEQLQVEEMEILQRKLEEQRQMQREIQQINEANLRAKERKKEEERLADLHALEYTRKKLEREAEYEAEQERIRKKKEQDVARLRALQERDRDHQAEQDALRARRNQEAAEREWRRKEKQDALNKAKEDEVLTRDRLQQVAHKEHLLSVQAGRERSEFHRVLRALEKSIAQDKEKEEKSQWERFHNADGLRQQIREREAQAIENRRENFREGERLNQEARDRRARLDEIKFKKLTELRLPKETKPLDITWKLKQGPGTRKVYDFPNKTLSSPFITNYEKRAEDFQNGSILLKDLMSSDEGLYIITITTNEGIEKDREIQLYIEAEPSSMEIPEPQTLVLDTEALLSCAVNGFYPQSISVTWFHRDLQVPLTSITNHLTTNRNGTFSLTSQYRFTPAVRDNGTVCRCQASHPAWRRHVTLERVLDVKNGPQSLNLTSQNRPVLGAGSNKTLELPEGSPLHVSCWSDGNPRPWTGWFKDRGDGLTPSEPPVGCSNETLHVGAVQREDEGVYWCVARNSYGERNTSFTLLVVVSDYVTSFITRLLDTVIFFFLVALMLICTNIIRDNRRRTGLNQGELSLVSSVTVATCVLLLGVVLICLYARRKPRAVYAVPQRRISKKQQPITEKLCTAEEPQLTYADIRFKPPPRHKKKRASENTEILYSETAGVCSPCEEKERFRLASYYGDHMVLQAGPGSAVIWGYGAEGATVTVSVEGKDKHTAKVLDGIWSVTLDPVKPGGPFTLTAEHLSQAGLTSLNLTDVLFGDVWLCGGQSNMEMTLSQVLGAGNFTQFSAVCWLFGRYLYEKLQYPVGLVESCWGGTPVEAWSSHRVLHRCGLVEDTIRSRFEYVDRVMGPRFNSVLWNAMIHPLLNMTIKGAIWYQGEDNTNYNLDLYNCTFPAMIDDWRLSFHQGSAGQTSAVFPFGFVQICTDNQGSPSDAFPRLRWHQTADFGFAPNPRMKNTFMAVSVDLVDPGSPWGSIHPRYKQDVARRLILGARAVAYGEKGVSFQGPFPTKVELKGNIMIITYSQKITVTHFNKDVFEVCCSKKKTACDVSSSGWAPAPVFNVYSNIVFLTTDNCPDEVSGLRYAWKDWPCDWKACPVYSADRVLPAPPFVVGPQGSGRWTILE